jgi:HEAT repeat protein
MRFLVYLVTVSSALGLAAAVYGASFDEAANRAPAVENLSLEQLLREFRQPGAFSRHPLPARTVEVINELRNREEPLIQRMKKDLKDSDPKVLIAAERVLAKMGEAARGAVPELVVALEHPNAKVRQNAVYALGPLRDPRAFHALIRASSDPSSLVRIAVVVGARPSLEDGRFATAVAALGDRNPHVCRFALKELSILKDKRALPYLVPLLEDQRSFAAGAGPHPDNAVRVCDEAALALTRIAGGRWRASLRGPRPERDKAVAKWKAWWAENREAVLAEVYPKKPYIAATH